MISSVDNPTVKAIAKLRQKKYRDKEKKFVVEGEHIIEAACEAGCLEAVYTVLDATPFDNATRVSHHVMKKMTGAKHVAPMIGVCQLRFDDLVHDRVLLLEHIQDPGNMGTLLRSALAFGFKTVVLDRAVDLTNPKVIRATQGALFALSFVFMDVASFNDAYSDHTLIATAPKGAPIDTLKTVRGPFALMLGNEGSGLSESALNRADYTVSISTEGIESLNVGVAGSILMHYARH